MARPARPPVGGRRTARERALGLLYEAELKAVPPRQIVDEQPVRPDEFAVDVAVGVGEHRGELDAMIGRFAKGWKVERMPAIDRNVLRMATYELSHRPDVPTAAVLSEAVELAKRFSTEDSGRFVNGVLARIAVEVRGDPPAGRAAAPVLVEVLDDESEDDELDDDGAGDDDLFDDDLFDDDLFDEDPAD